MGPEEIKAAITSWCNTDELQRVEDLTGSGSDVALGLRAAAGSGSTVPVEVLLERGADRVSVRSTTSSAAGGESDREVLDSRPALVSAQPSSSGSGSTVSGHVYLDGFSRQTFMQVVAEVAKTAGLLNARGGATEAAAEPTAAAAAATTYTELPASRADAWSPQAAQAGSLPYGDAQPVTPGSQPLPSPSFASPQQPAGYSPLSGQPAPQAQAPAQGGGFAPTHTVPPQGMQAWAAPDPTGTVVATLGGGLPIQVTEVRGAWARVLCSNGWIGWVDGRIIGVAR